MRQRRFSLPLKILIGTLVLGSLIAKPCWQSARAAHQDRLDADLLSACDRSDVERVKRMLQRGADPNTILESLPKESIFERLNVFRPMYIRDDYGHFGRTPLVRALDGSYRGQVINALLDYGARANQYPKEETYLLAACARWGDVQTAQRLLAQGIAVNENWRGMTALSEAIRGKETRMVQFLLDHGADATPEDFANADPEMTKILKKAGKKP